MEYVTLSGLKKYLGFEGEKHDGLLADAIGSVSREIEGYCGRTFGDSGAVSPRLFRPISERVAIVDDFHTVTGLVLERRESGSWSTWPAEYYQLEPFNGVVGGIPGWPYWLVRAISTEKFTVSDAATLRVTAQWGWAAVPKPVFQAAFILAAETFQLKDAPFGVAGTDMFGTIRVRDNRMAAKKLNPYVRDRQAVA